MSEKEYPWANKAWTATYIENHHQDGPINVAVPGIVQAASIIEAIRLRDTITQAILEWTIAEGKRQIGNDG
jgi:hypothetical protein